MYRDRRHAPRRAFALMELVLYSLDDATPAKQRETWPVIEVMLEQAPVLYARDIIYWSLGDERDDGSWKKWTSWARTRGSRSRRS